MSSQETEDMHRVVPTFTMKISGVEFHLEPKSSFGANIDFKPHAKDNSILLNLSNFSGVLKIVPEIMEDQSIHSVVSRISLSPERKKRERTRNKRVSPPPSASNSVVSHTKDTPKTKKQRKEKKAQRTQETIYEDMLLEERNSCGDEESMLGELPFQDVEDDDDHEFEDEQQKTGDKMKKQIIKGKLQEENQPNDINSESGDKVTSMQDCFSQGATQGDEMALMNPSQGDMLSQYEHGPSPRWGHTVTHIDKNRVVVYGGQSDDGSTLADIYIWSLLSKCWSKPVNVEGMKRQWHSTVFLNQRQLVVCFGGEAKQKGRMTAINDVMVLDTEIMLWYPPSVTGLIPSGRSGHSANIIDGINMYVFGGVRGQKWQNSVAMLDTARWKWSAIKIIGHAPPPRSYHSATSLQKENSTKWIVVFGGNDAKTCFNTVHVLEIGPEKQCCWINPLVSGDLPAPRTGHAATLLTDGSTILIHGGWDPNSDNEDETVLFRDSYLLNTKTWSWRRTLGQTTQGRVGHTALLNGNHVQVFGGRLPGDNMTNDWLTIHQDSSVSMKNECKD
eukprot:CAMPEP_0194147220 /NCGR_PEP_ID=MMETSP0152-20130528/22594_1 /TAXON_ID=1049557 /ORGANISM="Thalassiothrix antarctica, Strain L6-D1" /LENGTH=558 /DNA_ID=CAMNT_0038847935 /DNA_START=68 /DNA_END=1744 /DNA_ORIENTATION=-